MSEPMRYDLEDGKMVERPHCGAWVEFNEKPVIQEDIQELLDLIEDMQRELQDIYVMPNTFDSEVNCIKKKYNR